jgi:type VI protein secretion system component VasF
VTPRADKLAPTPTPWRAVGKLVEAESLRTSPAIMPPLVATVESTDNEDQDYANAALIVRAVNSHAALLDACRALLNAAERFDSLYDDDSRASAYAEELAELSACKDQARAALALAER